MGTEASYPVSWGDLPLNIMTDIVLVWALAMSPEVKMFAKYGSKHGLPGRLPVESDWGSCHLSQLPRDQFSFLGCAR